MRIICKANNGSALSPKYLTLGYADATQFNLAIDQCYKVHAMSIWRGALFFLIADDTGLPMWQPVDLFSLSDGRLPENWCFTREIALESGVEAIWGYERLTSDQGHYEALIEQDPEALKYFYQIAN